jgi:hypothetical protein
MPAVLTALSAFCDQCTNATMPTAVAHVVANVICDARDMVQTVECELIDVVGTFLQFPSSVTMETRGGKELGPHMHRPPSSPAASCLFATSLCHNHNPHKIDTQDGELANALDVSNHADQQSPPKTLRVSRPCST